MYDFLLDVLVLKLQFYYSRQDIIIVFLIATAVTFLMLAVISVQFMNMTEQSLCILLGVQKCQTTFKPPVLIDNNKTMLK